jgi:hypothetical protein
LYGHTKRDEERLAYVTAIAAKVVLHFLRIAVFVIYAKQLGITGHGLKDPGDFRREIGIVRTISLTGEQLMRSDLEFELYLVITKSIINSQNHLLHETEEKWHKFVSKRCTVI